MASKIGKFVQSLKDSVMGIPGKKKKFQKDAKDAKAKKAAAGRTSTRSAKMFQAGGNSGTVKNQSGYAVPAKKQRAALDAAFN